MDGEQGSASEGAGGGRPVGFGAAELLLGVQRVRGRERRRREKEERKRGKRKREKRNREKEKWRERKRELSAGFAAAVGHTRAAVFGRSATSIRNKRKGKGIGRRLVLVSGRRIAGTGFREIGSSGGKEFWIDLSSALKKGFENNIFSG